MPLIALDYRRHLAVDRKFCLRLAHRTLLDLFARQDRLAADFQGRLQILLVLQVDLLADLQATRLG